MRHWTYKDRIAPVRSGGSLVLDQAEVREYLGCPIAGALAQFAAGAIDVAASIAGLSADIVQKSARASDD